MDSNPRKCCSKFRFCQSQKITISHDCELRSLKDQTSLLKNMLNNNIVNSSVKKKCWSVWVQNRVEIYWQNGKLSYPILLPQILKLLETENKIWCYEFQHTISSKPKAMHIFPPQRLRNTYPLAPIRLHKFIYLLAPI